MRAKWLGRLDVNWRRASRLIRMRILSGLFEEHGANFWFDPSGIYSFENISVGSDVSLGVGCTILAARSKVLIGDNVMFGPGVTLVGGGHNTAVVGAAMAKVKAKTGNEDRGVVIEDDVWVGASAIVLRGVTIGRGSIVAAGAVVTRSCPPYSVVGGNPARVIKQRWPVDTILEHEERLYPPDKRLSREALTSSFGGPQRRTSLGEGR